MEARTEKASKARNYVTHWIPASQKAEAGGFLL